MSNVRAAHSTVLPSLHLIPTLIRRSPGRLRDAAVLAEDRAGVAGRPAVPPAPRRARGLGGGVAQGRRRGRPHARPQLHPDVGRPPAHPAGADGGRRQLHLRRRQRRRPREGQPARQGHRLR